MDWHLRTSKFFLAILLSFAFAACTRTTNKNVPANPDDTSLGGGSFGDDENVNFGGTNGGSSTSGGNMGNLFNQDLDENERTGNQQLSGNSLSANSQQCLASGSQSSIFYDDEYQGTGLNNAGSCLAANSQPVNAEQFYSTGENTLNGMEECLVYAMMVAPQTEQQAEQAHRMGRKVMFRCYAELASGMRNAIPWSNEQNGVYNNFIGNMNRMVYRSHNGQF